MGEHNESLSTLAVAYQLGVQPFIVRRMVQDGELTGHRVGKSRKLRVHADSVQRYLQRQRNAPATLATPEGPAA